MHHFWLYVHSRGIYYHPLDRLVDVVDDLPTPPLQKRKFSMLKNVLNLMELCVERGFSCPYAFDPVNSLRNTSDTI
jgi:hypothetical protein